MWSACGWRTLTMIGLTSCRRSQISTKSISGSQAAKSASGPFDRASFFFFDQESPKRHWWLRGLGPLLELTHLACVGGFWHQERAPSLPEMRRRVERYRHEQPAPHQDYTIGCRIVAEPIFFPESLLDRRQPASWSWSIVVWKTYSTEDREGLELWERIMDRGVSMLERFGGFAEGQARFGEPSLVTPRAGRFSRICDRRIQATVRRLRRKSAPCPRRGSHPTLRTRWEL